MPKTYQLSADSNADFETGSIFFIGTATVILRYASFTILTDPNFLHAGDHVHLGYGLTSERLTEPAINIEDFKRAVEKAGLTEKVVYLAHGETHDFKVAPNHKNTYA